jgi:Domain of unknown function (DUF4357)
MPSATIKLFLVHGDAKRLRIASISNWTGKGVGAPRSEIEELLAREEANACGVYFLSGRDPQSGEATLYLGEADCIRERLRGHLNKDDWNQVVFFISTDQALTKAHARFLEGRLIQLAKESGRSVLKNSHSSGSRLPEADQMDTEAYLERMLQLLPVLGIDALVPIDSASRNKTENSRLYCDIKGLRASGHLTPAGFLVLKGSQAVLEERASARNYPNAVAFRRRLIELKKLVAINDHLSFVQDVEFASPSAAAAAIHGGSANGLTAWKTEEGRTLKQLEMS